MTISIGIIKVTYPYAYNSQIRYYSNKYNLDECLVRAVVKVESGYNSTAISVAGACGLMQIMPKTAEWIAGELGIENFSNQDLFDANINIEMGCFYLNYLFHKYENTYKVLFAYNAGEGVLNEYYSADKVLVVETIEIIETKQYIEKVIKAQEGYRKLFKLTY